MIKSNDKGKRFQRCQMSLKSILMFYVHWVAVVEGSSKKQTVKRTKASGTVEICVFTTKRKIRSHNKRHEIKIVPIKDNTSLFSRPSFYSVHQLFHASFGSLNDTEKNFCNLKFTLRLLVFYSRKGKALNSVYWAIERNLFAVLFSTSIDRRHDFL